MEEEYRLNEIVGRIDIYDPVDDVLEWKEINEEKESCKTKQEQINFMYKYHSQNKITPRSLAKDYQFYYQDSGVDLRSSAQQN